MNPNNPLNPREQQLREDIMRRVRFIHGLRVLMSPAIVKASAFLASVIAAVSLVSVPHVVANMSHLGVSAYAPYIAEAYLHTNLAVQAAIILAVAVGAWLMRDIVIDLRSGRAILRTA